MGDPVRIKDLAEQMVSLSGFALRNAQNLMAISKLSALAFVLVRNSMRLLIDAQSQPLFIHLYRAEERSIPSDHLWTQLHALEIEIASQDVDAALLLLLSLYLNGEG